MNQTKDKHGAPVLVGSRVRVLDIRPSVIARLAPEEARDVRSMKGEVLEVYEIDEGGSAWVKKWWTPGGGSTYCHSLALAPDEMEQV